MLYLFEKENEELSTQFKNNVFIGSTIVLKIWNKADDVSKTSDISWL